MIDYRHVTNLRTPFVAADLVLFLTLVDYRIGEPVSAGHDDALSLEQMREHGIVGLYATLEAINAPHVRARTGWPEIKP